MSLEKWAARRYGQDIQAEPQTSKERMEQLLKIHDEQLQQKLAQWQNIRFHQDTHQGVADDVVRLDLLFKGINTDLERLGRQPLRAQGELP